MSSICSNAWDSDPAVGSGAAPTEHLYDQDLGRDSNLIEALLGRIAP